MRLGIDVSSANKLQRTGVEDYAFQLIQAMKRLPLTPDQSVVLYTPTSLDPALAESLPSGWSSQVLSWPMKRGWMQGRMSLEMFRHPPDILFVPAQGLPFFSPNGKRGHTMTTIHDIGFHAHPDLYPPPARRRLESVLRRALRRSSILLVPSEFTKHALETTYHVDPARIVVTPLAPDRSCFRPYSFQEIAPVLDKYRLGKGTYFFTIGRVEAKKNTANLIRAFEIFKQARGVGDPMTLVLAGTDGYGAEEVRQLCENSPFKQSIRRLGWVLDKDIPALLNGASAFLFPSVYEGFGIPNLEALACEVPLLTSDIPVHHEVVGEAGLFLSPRDTDAWAQAMERILEDQALRQDLITKGRIQVEKFSWERTAETTWKALFSL